MTHQLFDDMIGTPPPSAVDVDAIMRRTTGRRRLLRVAVPGAVVVLVLAAFSPLLLLPRGDRAPSVSVSPPSAAASVEPSLREPVSDDLDHFIDDSMRNWLPQQAQWIGAPPHIVVPPDGGDVTQTRAGIQTGGRNGTVVVTVWPRGRHDASICQGLEHCTELPRSDPAACARYEGRLQQMCEGMAKADPVCGRADGAVRPALGLTHPGWEVRCTKPGGGRAVSIFVTNQTGPSSDPLPQPELPIQPDQIMPIINVLVSNVQ
ncbi:hypothetical protein Daura_31660 [Dactylosporangium aurantiacum]|uniref:Uncharacterized protein n=1 Tax=Dactylosporangium aurantiacum TaxID=35754 RepID=A0A9Q9IEY5_9ACTN|nr:hypothetical protein [Dactylosporangium aurantiacum]MDG6109543.1 hypothetical protein [Dactylosporangium aurantiacum]UWZ51300.1 hypothetical protein Daura_31660 [Dactylosporangium aurantiacum]